VPRATFDIGVIDRTCQPISGYSVQLVLDADPPVATQPLPDSSTVSLGACIYDLRFTGVRTDQAFYSAYLVDPSGKRVAGASHTSTQIRGSWSFDILFR